MSILIIGGTGTLGSQIVKHALNNGYQTKCLVRNLDKSRFLRDWGAELIKSDLSNPEAMCFALKGVKYIIDASSSRLNDLDSLEKIDLEGKKKLILMAEKAKIKSFIFYSFPDLENYTFIPLVAIKLEIESILKKTKFSHTVFKIPGFYQGLIGQYSIPILENNTVLATEDNNPIPFIDAEDIAKISIKSMLLKTSKNKNFNLFGAKGWESKQIIALCETLSGQTANIKSFPLVAIFLLKNIASFFEWSWPIANRLLFIEILTKFSIKNNKSEDFKNVFLINESDLISLDVFLKDYFQKILKDLKQINFKKRKEILF